MYTKFWYPLIVLLAFALPAKSQTFVFTQLKGPQLNTAGWNLSGAAKVANVTGNDNSEILLTPAQNNTSGAIFFSQPINFGKCKRWSVEFDYRLFDGTGADGLAFCFLDAPPIGFQSASNLGIPKAAKGIKICIDTYNNCDANPTRDMPKVEARWGQGYGIFNSAGTLVTEGECRTDSAATTTNSAGYLNFLRSSNYNHVKITYESTVSGGTITVYTGIGKTLVTDIPGFNFAAYVGFTASTGGSNDNQSIKNVVVYTDMPPSEAGTSPTPVCPGTKVQIGTANNSSYVYSWSPSENLSSATISNPVATAVNNTGSVARQVFYVNTAFASNPGCSSVDSVVITVNPGPLADFDWPPVCLPNGTVTINNKTTINDGSDPNAADYTWTYPDNSTHKVKNPTVTFTNPGTYHFTLDVSSGASCKGHAEKDLVINPKAKAAITVNAPAGFCQDTAIQFNGSIGNLTAQSWHWDFADGATDSIQNPAHKFAINKTYAVKMYGVTTEGCNSDTTLANVTVNPLPIAGFTYTGLLCDGQSLNFTDASKPSTGTITAYSWVFDNNPPTTQNPVSKTFTTGAHTVSITVKNSAGCFSKAYAETINVGAIPVADFSVPVVCKNAAGVYTDASTIADGTESQFKYSWNFGDGSNPGTGKTPSHAYGTAGDHQVTITVTSGNGCIATKTKTVTISDYPVVDFSILTTNFCGNLPLKVKDNSSVQYGSLSAVTFYWDATSLADSTQVSPPVAGNVYSHNYPTFGYTGSRQVTLNVRAYAAAGCFSDKTGTSILFASPKLVFSAIPTLCQNSTQVITLNQAKDTGKLQGNGYYTGDAVSNGTFAPAEAGPGQHTITYYYTLSNGCTDSITQTATVGIKPTVSAGPTVIILKGGQAPLQASATGGTNFAYLWTPATYLDDNTKLNPVASPPTDKYYTLKATNGDGCFDTSGTLVKVLQFPVVPNAFSPNNDGINDTWQINYISSYPDCKVQVFNRYGQQVFVSTGYTRPWDGLYNGNPAPIGTYYYIITSANLPAPISGSVTLLR